MLTTLAQAIKFMTLNERLKYYIFLFLRASVGLLDLIGILAIGIIAASSAFLVSNGPESKEPFQIGDFSFPLLTVQSLPLAVGIVLLLFLFKALLSILFTLRMAKFLAKIEARAAWSIAHNAFGHGLERTRANSREEVLYAVQVGSQSAFNSLLNAIGTISAEGFLFILVITTFAWVNPTVAIGAVLYFGIIGIVIQVFIGQLMNKTGQKIADNTVSANTVLSDLGDVLRETYVLGKQDYFLNKVRRFRFGASTNYATQFVLSGMPRYIVETALISAIAVFVVFQALSGDIVSSAATLGVFLSGGLRLTASLLPLQSALLQIKQSIPLAKSALELVQKEETSSYEGENKTAPTETSHPINVDLQNLSFVFKGEQSETLSDVNMAIPAGSQVAFIGHSGAGKSTLADLILGILEPTSGSILLDGVNPKKLARERSGILGYVPQKPGLISGTIAQNIALGINKDEIDMERLLDALSKSHLADFVDSLPQGLETDLGKRKDELSGGQIQRIGLARALYNQPKLLVMDEATSALDAESESKINKALDEMRGKTTVILIAHRLNTIQRSDTVYLLESGKIQASGAFSTLLRTNETVKGLARLMSIETYD